MSASGSERERLPVGAIFVGAGPACLAGALHLANLIRSYNEGAIPSPVPGVERRPMEIEIAVLEKAREVGQHGLSGAVLNPCVLGELVPDYGQRGFPGGMKIQDDRFVFLGRSAAFRIPGFLVPPANHNQGFWTVSLQRLTAWMATLCEEAGVQIFSDTTAVALETRDGAVTGVLTGDKGLGRDGVGKDNHQPGIVLEAPVTILGEGPRGTLAEDLVHQMGLGRESAPQIYSLGVKEIIRVPQPRVRCGTVVHTMGHPLSDTVFGGGFLYSLEPDLFALGLVASLAWRDPSFDAQHHLQLLKAHPYVHEIVRGGEVLSYGAKVIPEGGYWSLPRAYAAGALVVGDSAGLVNIRQLKGIHYAMKSGMLAAETAFEALLAEDASETRLSAYGRRLAESFVYRDLYRDRNFRYSFHGSFRAGLLKSRLRSLFGGGSRRRPALQPDHACLSPSVTPPPPKSALPSDGNLFIDKLTAVYKSGTLHREDQPSHIRILDPKCCTDTCIPRFGTAPCTHFCPANVYELVDDGPSRHIQINFSNCVHCKTCVILDPIDVSDQDNLQNIDWRAPAEGGPKYNLL